MKKIRRTGTVLVFIFFSFYSISYSVDKKDDLKQYLNKINPILTNAQITARNLSQKLIPLEGAIKQMGDYIDTLDSLTPPPFMIKQHKIILLSFRKLKMGFYLLSRGEKAASVRLVTRGRDLLRIAVNDILEFGRKEGLIKETENAEK